MSDWIRKKVPGFKSKSELYTVRFNVRARTVQVGEVRVKMPVKPPEHLIVNSDLPKKQQKFAHTKIPSDLRLWPKEYQDQFIAAEWHKRKNGVWYYINGKAYYITGPFYFFLNYWHAERGGLPDFREEAMEFFWFWDHCQRDPNCYGMLDVKPRRIGDTEKALCALYERWTRRRATNFGMMNVDENEAQKNFTRMVEANYRMVYYFKLQHEGKDRPKNKLTLKIPSEVNTSKKLKEMDRDIMAQMIAAELTIQNNEHGGEADYVATKKGAYDGRRLTSYHGDEFAKVVRIDITDHWDVVKLCLTLEGGSKIVGKAIYSSTVEDKDDGKSVEVINAMWDDSNPNDINPETNQTTTGLYRYFRNVELVSPTDEYGFHIRDLGIKKWKGDIAALEAKGRYDKVIDYKRRFPLTIKDALTMPSLDCTLLPFFLDKQIELIENEKDPDGLYCDYHNDRFSLHWENGFGSNVMAVNNPEGNFVISQHPDRPNAYTVEDGKKRPANKYKFSAGCDPVDHGDSSQIKAEQKAKNGEKSKAALSIFRKFDPNVDNKAQNPKLHISDDGKILNPWHQESNQFVCSYAHRHANPNDFYEEMAMAAIYFGVPLFVESNKNSIQNYFNDNGLGHYLQYRPLETMPLKTRKSTGEKGVSATPQIVNQYVSLLLAYVSQYSTQIKHIEMLKCMRKFNTVNRTERDLTVSMGFALLGAQDKRLQATVEEEDDQWGDVEFCKFVA